MVRLGKITSTSSSVAKFSVGAAEKCLRERGFSTHAANDRR